MNKMKSEIKTTVARVNANVLIIRSSTLRMLLAFLQRHDFALPVLSWQTSPLASGLVWSASDSACIVL